MELSRVGGHVRAVDGGWRDHHLVRHRLDRPTRRVGTARRGHRGDLRGVRQVGAFPRRRDRRADLPAFPTGDIIKGSVTLDPDGFPILYTGSRDNKLRAISLDRDRPTELWAMDADVVNGIWNNDWDGNPVVVDDILYEGGENSWFFAIRLNRGYDGEGLVTVDPEILVAVRYTDE